MTSVLNVDTIADKAGTGTVTLTKQSAAKVWAKYDAGSTLNDSFNVSSLADAGTGQYEPSFTNNMSNANYPAQAEGNNSGYSAYPSAETTGENTTSKFRDMRRSSTHSAFDSALNRCSVHGDLA